MKNLFCLLFVAVLFFLQACSHEPVCGGLIINIPDTGDYHYVRRPLSRLGPVYQLGPSASLIIEVEQDGKLVDVSAPPLKARVSNNRKVTLMWPKENVEAVIVHGTRTSPYAIHRKSLNDFREALEKELDADYARKRMSGSHTEKTEVMSILHDAVVSAARRLDPDGDHVVVPGDKKLVLSRLRPPYSEK